MPTTPEPKRRLFFALWPDDAVRRQIAVLSRQACERPVSEANLHLTLFFLGMQGAAARDCFCKAAGTVQSGPFTLLLDRYGGWAQKKIQWLGPSDPPRALGDLAGGLVSALTDCGIEAEKRHFVPHVTLSRKAKKPLEDLVPAPVHWDLNEFVLAESVPSSDGVRYVVLERWTL